MVTHKHGELVGSFRFCDKAMKENQEEVCCFCGKMFERWTDYTGDSQAWFCRYECGYDFACETMRDSTDVFIDEARQIAKDWYENPKNPLNKKN